MSSATENVDKYSNNICAKMIQDTINTRRIKEDNCSGGTLSQFIFKFNFTRILILDFIIQDFLNVDNDI
jgi:hypothetical protein